MDAYTTWIVPPALSRTWERFGLRALYVGPPERSLRFSFPQPAFTDFEDLLEALADAGAALGARPVAERAAALSHAAERLRRPEDRERSAALSILARATGCAPAMSGASLDAFLDRLTPSALETTVRRASAAAGDLDRFSPAEPGRRRRAVGPALTVHVLAGNTPWAGLESVAAAVLAGSASLVKLSSREPVMAGLFAAALAEADPALAPALSVLHWSRSDRDLEEAAFERADAVVAFGDNAAVGTIAERLAARIAAGRVRFVPRGHRLSAALIGAGARRDRATAEAVARALAVDFALEDQEGCLSPHGAYLEHDVAAGDAPLPVGVEEFAALVAEALEERERIWPRKPLGAAEAARLQQARGAAEMRGATVHAPEGSTRWTVVLDPHVEFEPSPLHRYAWLKPVPDWEVAVEALRPARGLLAAVGLAGFGAREEEVAEALAALRPGRLCPVGSMQRPPAGWNHDGLPDLVALLTPIEREEGPAVEGEAHAAVPRATPSTVAPNAGREEA